MAWLESIYPAIVLTAVVFGTYLLHKVHMRRRRVAGKISEILIYPLKSGPPISLKHAECTEAGLKYKNLRDRQFIIVGEGSYFSASKNIKLTNISLVYDEDKDCLVFSAPSMTDISVPLKPSACNKQSIKKFKWYDGQTLEYLDCGDVYADWLSEVISEKCRLGYYHSDMASRKINPEETTRIWTRHKDSRVFYNSSHPYLICTESSLNDLNKRLQEPVGFEAFRPNLAISGAMIQPYEEDNWREIYVGDTIIGYNERSCPRCMRIYVDYTNKKMRPDKEPMRTLLKYRRGEAKDKSRTIFGIHVSLSAIGHVQIGDVVSVKN